jgi:hypothetical protein
MTGWDDLHEGSAVVARDTTSSPAPTACVSAAPVSWS